jgi:UDP-N-acetylmuramyl pentapeptide phosphotransferase/UDP-N-acetylglucosamine-1-phosphate transferase
MMKLVLLFLCFTALSFLSVIQLLRWLKKSKVYDIPNDRSVHSLPTPRGGGLVIVILVLVTVFVYSILRNAWDQSLFFLPLAGVIAWIGWKDDLHSLSPKIRFLAQGLVAVITMAGLGYFHYITIPLIGEIAVGWVGIPLTLLWIVGLTNAYNFMDGLDGFAGGAAVIIAGGWMWASTYSKGVPNELAYWTAFAIASGSLGFLFCNWPPAKIFMGDVASTFLGYCFAVLPLLSSQRGGEPVLVGVLLMWAFILDTGVTFARRAIHHERLFAAHRSHLYQRWVLNGMNPLWVNFIFYFFFLLAIFLLWGWFNQFRFFPALIVIGLPLLWIVLSYLTRKKENVE